MTSLPDPLLTMLAEPWGPGSHPFRACAICGESWRPFAFSRLPCHARCLFSEEDQRTLLELREAGRTDRELADALRVTVGIVRANVHAALVRVGRQGLRR